MSDTFDTILKNGIVVNQDGEGQRDIGIRDGRIAALGSFGPEQAGNTIDCCRCTRVPGFLGVCGCG